MGKKVMIVLGIIVVIVLLALGICLNLNGDTQDDNTFVLGMDDNFPPMGFRNENNELVGFDIDLAQEVCNKLGLELKVQPISWAAKEQELDSGNIDCIWNGFGYTEERNEAMTLSEPYLKDKSMFVVRTDSPYNSQEELIGKKIGIQNGSVQERRLAESDFGKSLGEVIGYSDYLTALMDLETGNVDAVYMSEISGNYIMNEQGKEFKTFDASIGEESKGMVVAFKKGNVELKDKVDKAIEELRQEGKLSEISIKWFGKDITNN